MGLVIATDIGGTFTDMVAFDTDSKTTVHAKSHTDPGDLTGGIIRCLQKSGLVLSEATDFVHGSTVAINTAIERKGAVTALIVTRGMRDVYAIGRGNRPEAYNLFFERPEPFVPRSRIIEIDERLDAAGNVVTPLDPQSVHLHFDDEADGKFIDLAAAIAAAPANAHFYCCGPNPMLKAFEAAARHSVTLQPSCPRDCLRRRSAADAISPDASQTGWW